MFMAIDITVRGSHRMGRFEWHIPGSAVRTLSKDLGMSEVEISLYLQETLREAVRGIEKKISSKQLEKTVAS